MLAFLLVFVLSACGGKSEPVDASQLVGNWAEVDIDNTYTFNADGTGSEYFEGDSWDMTWTLDGNDLTLDFPETGVEEFTISLKGDTLKVKNLVTYTYKRQ
ncbi:hypothetical protein AGMMS49983_14080 [Clostridia bacterium]|nr:hypothetical protein AGMMS49983_14080 [Clostridia bacterium]